MAVREVQRGDTESWLRMRQALWPDGTAAEHREDIEQFLAGKAAEPLAVLVAEKDGTQLVGFAELSIRPYAEGCHSRRVAYLEGWFVEPESRRRGVGRALVAAAEEWGREQGCSEAASDAHPDNGISAAAHVAAGFQEVGLIRCFKKDL